MNKFKITNNYKKILFYLAVILWMSLIFYLSAQPVQQSNGLSKKVTEVVVETVERIVPTVEINHGQANHIIRKNAHFFAYLILGVLIMNALRVSDIKGFKAIIFALILCILYAISDEFHQLFVPGRGGQIRDVLIDTAGGIIGITISSFFGAWHRKMNLFRIGLLVILFMVIMSGAVFAMDGISVEDTYMEVHEIDLNHDGVNERVKIIREALTPSYISYYVYDLLTEDLLFSRENLYRGIVEVRGNRIIEKLPIYNEGYFGVEDCYEQREYILEDGEVICISNMIKCRQDLIGLEGFSNEHYDNPSRAEIESILEEVALNRGIPPTILKAIAYTESNYRQFHNGKPLLSFDGVSWGVMQVTPKFYPKLDIERLKYDIVYNIEAGADILLGKWGYGFGTNPKIPTIGGGDIRVLEDWYFAIWAYNGWSENNNPNMIPYKHSSWTQNEAYQDKVLRHGKEILGQEIVSIPKELLPMIGKPDPKVSFEGLANCKEDKYRLFVENQIVEVVALSGLKIRNDMMKDIETISNGESLKVLGPPILYDGYYRYKVERINTGKVGWVAANWLKQSDKTTKGTLVWQKKMNVENDKIWTIDFNLPVDNSSVSDDTVYIEDCNGNKVGLILSLENENKSLKIKATDLFKSGQEYTLWVKGVKTSNGSRLSEYININFVVR